MRVLHVNLAREFRGGERQTLLLAEALCAHDVRQSYLLARGSMVPAHWDAPLPCLYTSRNFPLRVVRGFNLVHAHEAKAVKWAYWNSLFTGVPYVAARRMHSLPSNNPLTRRAYAAAHCIICESRAVEDSMRAHNPKLRLLRIPGAYTPTPPRAEVVREIRARYAGAFLVGNLGALVDKHKGQSVLIDAARALRAQCPAMRFLLLGAGPDEARLREQARGLPSVEFCGFQKNPADWLAAFDLFVMPSRHDAWGSALIDAMHAAKPIVASDVDGIPDLIQHEQNGLLVPPGDARALATALLRLYENRELAQTLGARATEDAERSSPARIAEQNLALYREVLAR